MGDSLLEKIEKNELKRNMKKLIIYGFILISGLGYGQERVDGTIINFKEKGPILSEANLYRYDKDTEKWVEKLNALQNYYGLINFRTIEYNNVKYYVLCSNTVEVRYKYPAISEGRYINPIYNAYIFSEAEFLKLKNLGEGVSDFDEIRTTHLDLEELRIQVLSYLKGGKPHYEKFIMKIKKENDLIVRFRCPEKYESWTQPFEKKYFETSLVEFNKLFLIE